MHAQVPDHIPTYINVGALPSRFPPRHFCSVRPPRRWLHRIALGGSPYSTQSTLVLRESCANQVCGYEAKLTCVKCGFKICTKCAPSEKNARGLNLLTP